MGASLVSRLTYVAASRLDGIGQWAIGDMISSALKSSLGIVERFTSVTYPGTNIIAVAQAWCKSESGVRHKSDGLRIFFF